jgi:ABC-type enterochelin transport system substrate-binding protein
MSNTRDKIDALIEWYEKHNPEAGKVIFVTCSENKLSDFAMRVKGTNRWQYRGRILEKRKAP